MSKPWRITLIFILAVTAICLVYEIVGIASKDVVTLSPVIQEIFYRIPAVVVAVGYLMGHFIIRLNYKLRLWISLTVLASLMCLSQVVVIFVPVEPIIFFGTSFTAGIFLWNQSKESNESMFID
jgi:hypothetical protein